MTAPVLERLWADGPVLLAPHGLPRPEWLRSRKVGIGGSDVGAILGLDHYRSPLAVYMEKRGELADDEAGEAAEWGNLLEPVVAMKWAADAGASVWSPGVLAHAERTWQIANPDRFYVRRVVEGPELPEVPDGLLEVKTANQYLSDDWDPDSERMPDRARLQVQHYMDVTGLRESHVACLIGGQQLRVFREPYDFELAEMVRAETNRFWHDHVLAGNPPPIDGSKATSELLGRLWEVDPDDVAVVNPLEIRPLLERREHAKAVIKGADADLDLVENQLKALLGPKQVGVVDGRPVVTWKQQTRKSYVVQESTFRVLRIPKGALDVL